MCESCVYNLFMGAYHNTPGTGAGGKVKLQSAVDWRGERVSGSGLL